MMKIGFTKKDISPPVGMELGGYAGYRPCAGIHDPLWCKAVVLEQEDVRYALVALDLMCVDEPLYHRIAETVAPLGISRQRLLVCAIHSHAAPAGLIPGAGGLSEVNAPVHPDDPMIRDYMDRVVVAAAEACAEAAGTLENFQVRKACGEIPPVGSERHTGCRPDGRLTVVQCRTTGGRLLTAYNFPCHPTVTNAENLLASGYSTIKEAAYRSGFSDMAYFRRCFLKKYSKMKDISKKTCNFKKNVIYYKQTNQRTVTKYE